MKSSEVIRDAMNRVAKGWCKWALMNDEGNVCMAGAMMQASGMGLGVGNRTDWYGADWDGAPQESRDLYYSARGAIADVIKEQYGHTSVSAMNDSTTQPEVLAVMEKAALGLEERGE